MDNQARKLKIERPTPVQSVTINTSLYELIEVLQQELGEDNDRMAARLIQDLIENSQLRPCRRLHH